MARGQQVFGSRRTLAYAAFIGVTFGLALSVVTITHQAERQGRPLRDVFSLQVSTSASTAAYHDPSSSP